MTIKEAILECQSLEDRLSALGPYILETTGFTTLEDFYAVDDEIYCSFEEYYRQNDYHYSLKIPIAWIETLGDEDLIKWCRERLRQEKEAKQRFEVAQKAEEARIAAEERVVREKKILKELVEKYPQTADEVIRELEELQHKLAAGEIKAIEDFGNGHIAVGLSQPLK